MNTKTKIEMDSKDPDGLLFRQLLNRTGTKAYPFLIPVCFSMATAVFEGISIGLLMPLVKGVIAGNFRFMETGSAPLRWLAHFSLSGNRPNAFALIILILVIISAATLKNVFQYGALVSLDRVLFGFYERLRGQIFEKMLSYKKAFFDQSSLGYLTNLVLNHTLEIVMSVKQMNRHLTAVLMLVPYLILMLMISWQLTLIGMVTFPALHAAIHWVVRRIRQSSRQAAHYQNELGRHLSNVLMAIPLIKASGMEKRESEEFLRLNHEAARHKLNIEKKAGLIPSIQEMMMIGAFLLLVCCMALVYKKGYQSEIAGLLVFFVILRRAMNSIASIGGLRAALSRVHGPLTDVEGFFESAPLYVEKEGSVEKPVFENEIRIKNVSFAYRQGVPVFQNLNLVLPKGKVTAIVGDTGSGKSSIVQLLLGFYLPDSGCVQIDGVDTRELTSKSLRALFALVSQETCLFHESLRYNITYGLGREVSRNEVDEALKIARFDAFVHDLPDGLETIIGDRGVQLSGGERQRLAIARAILKKAPVLIFDEATSALDVNTEQLVQGAIQEAVKGRTAIVIAHRLSTIKGCDSIVVLENGCVVEQGSFQELLKQKGKFRSYWEQHLKTE